MLMLELAVHVCEGHQEVRLRFTQSKLADTTMHHAIGFLPLADLISQKCLATIGNTPGVRIFPHHTILCDLAPIIDHLLLGRSIVVQLFLKLVGSVDLLAAGRSLLGKGKHWSEDTQYNCHSESGALWAKESRSEKSTLYE